MKRTLLITLLALVILGIGTWLHLDSEKEDIGNEPDKAGLIRLESPRPNETITSPLVIKGEARGYWFFEASFPVHLTDWDGKIIADGIATAKGDWMTEDFVPFEATLNFVVEKDVYSNKGTLILRKDNPSGLPENDDALEIPVVFSLEEKEDNSGILPFDSGVSGTVLLGPVCPVMREGDTSCADKPFETTVQVFTKNGSKTSPFAVAKTDKEGRYKISLPSGEYVLQPTGGKPFPNCQSTTYVIVEPNKTTEVNLSCDTGIR